MDDNIQRELKLLDLGEQGKYYGEVDKATGERDGRGAFISPNFTYEGYYHQGKINGNGRFIL